jgi:hypothetical protein
MGMIGNTPMLGQVASGNIQDGSIDTIDIKDQAVTPGKLSAGAPSWDANSNMTSSGPTATATTTGAAHQINGTFDAIPMSRHGTQAAIVGNWSGAGGFGIGSGNGHTVKIDQVNSGAGANKYDYAGATDVDLQLGANRKVSHTGTEKLGVDFTSSTMPKKFAHDFLWVQSAGAVLAPSQIPIYCANIDDAEKLAAWYLQRLFTELKTTENDSSWDGLHNYLLTYAGVFSKIVAGGGAAPNLGTVDYDNAVGDNTTSFFTSEWFEVVIGSNGSTELYTMSLAQGLTSTTATYPTRIVYQKTRNAADWRTDYPSANLSINEVAFNSAPKCTLRGTTWTPGSSNPAIFLYPITLELNF